MLYRFTHALAEAYGFVAFGCFVLLFLIAFAFTVLYPIVPLILIMLAPFAVVLAVGGSRLLRIIEHSIARRRLQTSRCPNCGGRCEAARRMDSDADDEAPVEALACAGCGRAFAASGRLLQTPPQSSSSAAH